MLRLPFTFLLVLVENGVAGLGAGGWGTEGRGEKSLWKCPGERRW